MRLVESIRSSLPQAPVGTSRNLFFSRLWIVAAVLGIVAGLILDHRPLLLLSVLVLLTAAVTAVWNRFALSSLTYTRDLSAGRAFPDDDVLLTLTVSNLKPLPVPFVTIDEEIDESLVPVDRQTLISGKTGKRILRLETSIRPFEQVKWDVVLSCTHRGEHQIGPAEVRSGDPFAFFSTRQTFADPARVLVYPRIHELEKLEVPVDFPLGDARVARHVITDPMRVIGVREYRPEDPFRSIHWNATARSSTLQVKQFEPVATLSLAIVLNLETFDRYWEGVDPVVVEEMIETAASLAEWGQRSGYSVGLFSNGSFRLVDADLHIKPATGEQHLLRILTALARLWPYSASGFQATLANALQSLPLGSTTVVITSTMNTPIEALILQAVSRGRRVVLVPAGKCPIPKIRGLTVLSVGKSHPPVNRDEAA